MRDDGNVAIGSSAFISFLHMLIYSSADLHGAGLGLPLFFFSCVSFPHFLGNKPLRFCRHQPERLDMGLPRRSRDYWRLGTSIRRHLLTGLMILWRPPSSDMEEGQKISHTIAMDMGQGRGCLPPEKFRTGHGMSCYGLTELNMS